MERILGTATYRAYANIAFTKYWGVSDPRLNLPHTNSLSMTLSHSHTTTTVQWVEGGRHAVIINDRAVGNAAARRIILHLERIRGDYPETVTARVRSVNSFPPSAGIASSASGFCALTLAAQEALHGPIAACAWLPLACQARLASGSACRSFYGGFVEWRKGEDHLSSAPWQLHDERHWDLSDLVVVVDTGEKAVSSQDGHLRASTSPMLAMRINYVDAIQADVRRAVTRRDLPALGVILERDAWLMHTVMMTSRPPLMYWHQSTMDLMLAVWQWREREGIPVYFTIDAGPNLHLICERQTRDAVIQRLETRDEVLRIIVNQPGPGPARRLEHLLPAD